MVCDVRTLLAEESQYPLRRPADYIRHGEIRLLEHSQDVIRPALERFAFDESQDKLPRPKQPLVRDIEKRSRHLRPYGFVRVVKKRPQPLHTSCANNFLGDVTSVDPRDRLPHRRATGPHLFTIRPDVYVIQLSQRNLPCNAICSALIARTQHGLQYGPQSIIVSVDSVVHETLKRMRAPHLPTATTRCDKQLYREVA